MLVVIFLPSYFSYLKSTRHKRHTSHIMDIGYIFKNGALGNMLDADGAPVILALAIETAYEMSAAALRDALRNRGPVRLAELCPTPAALTQAMVIKTLQCYGYRQLQNQGQVYAVRRVSKASAELFDLHASQHAASGVDPLRNDCDLPPAWCIWRLEDTGYTKGQGGLWFGLPDPAIAQEMQFEQWVLAHVHAGFKTDEALLAVFGNTDRRRWATAKFREMGVTARQVQGHWLWRTKRTAKVWTREQLDARIREIGAKLTL